MLNVIKPHIHTYKHDIKTEMDTQTWTYIHITHSYISHEKTSDLIIVLNSIQGFIEDFIPEINKALKSDAS